MIRLIYVQFCLIIGQLFLDNNNSIFVGCIKLFVVLKDFVGNQMQPKTM